MFSELLAVLGILAITAAFPLYIIITTARDIMRGPRR